MIRCLRGYILPCDLRIKGKTKSFTATNFSQRTILKPQPKSLLSPGVPSQAFYLFFQPYASYLSSLSHVPQRNLFILWNRLNHLFLIRMPLNLLHSTIFINICPPRRFTTTKIPNLHCTIRRPGAQKILPELIQLQSCYSISVPLSLIIGLLLILLLYLHLRVVINPSQCLSRLYSVKSI